MDDDELALFTRLLNEAFHRQAVREAYRRSQNNPQPDLLQVECYYDGKLYASSDGGRTWVLIKELSPTPDADRLIKSVLGET
jgi:hypothetical protein